MKVEICDVCKVKEPDKKFKVKMSRRGMGVSNGKMWMWDSSIWQPYEKISICEDCAEKLLGIMSQKTRIKNRMKEIAENKVR